MELGLLQEWVTWFADPPIGGGPVDGSLSLEIQVVAESEETGEFGDSGDTAPPVGEAGPPGETRPLATGACGCAATSSPWGGLIALLMALLLKTRGS